MSKPSPREIMDGFEASRAKTFFYMAQALIDELGEEKGRQVIRDTVWKMSKTSGRTIEPRMDQSMLSHGSGAP